MTVKEKLEEFDLFDQAIIRHGMLEYIRDYEVIGFLSGLDFDSEMQYIFKGCIKVEYKIKVAPEHFSMDDRLLKLDRQDEPDYPEGFIWGTNFTIVYPGWKIMQDTIELKEFEKLYGLKFYKICIETNAYDLNITFHDIEINEIKRIEKNKKLSI